MIHDRHIRRNASAGNGSMNGSMRIELSKVRLTLEDRTVFDGLDLSLDVRRLGLVGRNGAGKSQLLRLIAGLTRPDDGTVRVGGFDPAKDRKAATSRIGFVFQNPDHALLFPTVLEELTFGPKAKGAATREAEQLAQAHLARFGVAHWHDRLVHSLSQGQKHLLGLMVASIGDPDILLMDEAFAGLDLPTTLALRRVLEELPAARIEASHDLDSLMGCDRVLWIDAGAVRQAGAPGEVIGAYRDAMSGQGGFE